MKIDSVYVCSVSVWRVCLYEEYISINGTDVRIGCVYNVVGIGCLYEVYV